MSTHPAFADEEVTLSTGDLLAIGVLVQTMDVEGDDRSLYEQLDALERVKAQLCARQAALTQDLTARERDRAGASTSTSTSTSARQRVKPERVCGAQVALARRESPHRGQALVALARALRDLPETYAALQRGDINEHRAEIVATGTRDLTRTDRLTVDATLAHQLGDLGDHKLRVQVRRLALALDDHAETERLARARKERRVQCRIRPDGSHQVTAHLSAEQYAAVVAVLIEATATARAAGDARTRGQVQADLIADRVAGPVFSGGVPAHLNLTMPASTLLGDDETPAHLQHVGPIPAELGRHLAGAALRNVRTLVKRLFTFDGTLVAMEQSGRHFTGELADYLHLREQHLCRTPWCNAPVRHSDHVRSAARGGATTADNGEGLCEACNLTKEAPGFRHQVVSGFGEPHTVQTTTPAGLTYLARAPDLPEPEGTDQPADGPNYALTVELFWPPFPRAG